VFLSTVFLRTSYRYSMIAVVALLAGCASGGGDGDSQNHMTQRAAEYCESIGGETDVQKTSLGTGRYCRLPDGRVENQRQLYRTERLDND
jgi:putative hemolysin